MNLEKYIGCSQAARKQIKADLVLKNASIVNVFTDRVERGNIAIKNGIIVGIGDFKGEEELDIGGQYVTWSWGDWVFYGDYPVFNCTTDGNYDANGEHGDWYPIEQIRNRTWLGYKYFNFGQGVGGGELTLTLSLKEFAPRHRQRLRQRSQSKL